MATAAGTARALEKPAPLSQAEALEILNAMPRMVATSNTRIKAGSIVLVAYEVCSLRRGPYTFPEQPFYVLREITFVEYCLSLPSGLRAQNRQLMHFYEIATD